MHASGPPRGTLISHIASAGYALAGVTRLHGFITGSLSLCTYVAKCTKGAILGLHSRHKEKLS